MNIPMSWLKSYVDIEADVQQVADDMTMSGSKVETLTRIGYEIKNVVTGKILAVEKHPDADKLVVCKIDIGERQVQIVTGAKNVEAGQYVPVALNGAVLAEGKKITNSKLRGVESQGMMCSIEELGYTRQDYPEAPEDGIYIFQSEQPLGADACEILAIREEVIEFEITSNRPDCYSVIGLAREAAATFGKKLNYPVVEVKEAAGGDVNDYIQVAIQNPSLCPRYVARVVKNVKIGPSPQWLRHRLTTSGVRPINNIVDITNYVMLEFGQPMHAFDIDGIAERKIIVRNALEGEVMATLDGTQRKLDPSMLVIADTEKAVAIAGVMGGENSKVSGASSAILFESANFNGANVRKTSKKLGLRTDASSKYEKGLDPNLCIESINRCVQLVEELGIGEVVSGVCDCYPNKRVAHSVDFCENSINKLLGTCIPKAEMDRILEMLTIKVNGGTAIIPTFRPDIVCEADIAEEIARIYGYDNIETTLAAGTPTAGKKSYKQIIEDRIKNTMVSLGFSESMHYSFESPRVFDRLSVDAGSDLRNAVKIINPLGEDFSIMRTTTLNGMLNSLATNYNMRNEEVMLFEYGKKYMPKQLPLTELPEELDTLTIGVYAMENSDIDFFYLKGVLEELFAVFDLTEKVAYTKEPGLACMHPGRCANISIDGALSGFVGELHPKTAENYGIGAKVYIAVIEGGPVVKAANLNRAYKALPKYPAVSRDIAILVKEDIEVKDIENGIKASGGSILEEVKLFDVYQGKQIEAGYKSVAYSISFRAGDRTLTDDEVSKQMDKILKNLREKLAVVLRDK